jgi:phosphoglycolate phosphatase-like HAD superfamily hydrolase
MREARLVFWDFDGVVKESVETKTRAYVSLFEPYGAHLAERVREHHLAHGGMSRFDKLPRYLEWAGVEPTPARVTELCDRFATAVRQAVIDSPWVPGVERILRENPYGQRFVVVTGTPHEEIRDILGALGLTSCFTDVHGAPTSKADAIRTTLQSASIRPDRCLAIGDARTDLEAARANAVPFLLVRNADNAHLFNEYTGESIEDFTSL